MVGESAREGDAIGGCSNHHRKATRVTLATPNHQHKGGDENRHIDGCFY